MTAYYNEFDPHAAAWLRQLIAEGHIAPGIVDERSIEDVHPSDLRGFTQCHFFAGIGVWSYALRRAGWSDDRPVWTGSCPCQPFSAAGKGAGFDDQRHLWPAWHHLIKECRPGAILGEQVASNDGLAWLDLVLADLEAEDYAAAAADLCAAGVGAPHIRQRLYFVAHTHRARLGVGWRVGLHRAWKEGAFALERLQLGGLGDAGGPGFSLRQQPAMAPARGRQEGGAAEQSGGASDRMADADSQRHPGVGLLLRPEEAGRGAGDLLEAAGGVEAGRLGDADGDRSWRDGGNGPGAEAEGDSGGGADGGQRHRAELAGGAGHPGPTNGFWGAADWLLCRDGKWRPVEPGTFPLAHGAAARVVRLRGYGNAVNAETTAAFIVGAMGAI